MLLLANANALSIPLADKSVHCVITSPPYFGLRSYSGTGQWVGGDPTCNHAVREDPHLESSTLQGGKMTVGHQQEGYKDYCRRCGAIRVDNQLGLEQIPDCGAWNRGLFEPTIDWDEDGEPYIDWIRRDEIQLCGKCYVCQMVAVFREIRTLLVARQLGRRGVGLDLSYEYLHDQARKRLELDKLDAWENGIQDHQSYQDLPLFQER